MEIALRLARKVIAVATDIGPVLSFIADQVVETAILEEPRTVKRITALVLHHVFGETRFRTACSLEGASHSIDCPPRAIGFASTVALCSSATSRKGEQQEWPNPSHEKSLAGTSPTSKRANLPPRHASPPFVVAIEDSE